MSDPEGAWTVWLAVAVVLFGIELLLAGAASGVLFLFSVMALAGMAMALMGAPLLWQFVVATVIGILSLPLAVWIYRRYGPGGGPPSTTQSQMLHNTAFKAYYDARGNLRVAAMGEEYAATPETQSQAQIEDGSAVQIVRLEGVKAVIRPVDAAVGSRLDS
ncbi:hypothetical protein LRD18_06430 [Halorhodospira halochloris]|nr:hypothetical protein [Halorhodospira halochloris]MCG5530508.1 hypothetical protein [Halorhodospira halochloris]